MKTRCGGVAGCCRNADHTSTAAKKQPVMNKEIYYTTPIEVWRGALDDPKAVFGRVLDYLTIGCDTYNDYAVRTGTYMTNNRPEECEMWFMQARERVRAYLDGVCLSGVLFSVSSTMFFEYVKPIREGRLGEFELLYFLCYMALHSIGGRKGQGAKDYVRKATGKQMLIRAGGFGTNADFANYINGDEAILWYIEKERYWARRVKLELMARFDGFTAYSPKGGVRGFYYMFHNTSLVGEDVRPLYLRQLVEYAQAHNKTQKKRDIEAMTAQVEAEVLGSATI